PCRYRRRYYCYLPYFPTRRSSDLYLEEIGALDAIAFDKTGTLTKGVPVMTDFEMINDHTDKNKILSIISALEYRSQHPLASAIMSRANDENISYSDVPVEDFSSIMVLGISGKIDGTQYYVGNSRLFSDLPEIHLNDAIENTITSLQQQGKTVMLAGTANSIEAIIAVADEVRETSQESLRRLHEAGIKETIMLTGDNQSTANAIGEQVGVTDVRAE